MHMRIWISICALWLTAAGITPPARAQSAGSEFSFSDLQTMTQRHCSACHTGAEAQAGFDLTKYPSPASVAEARDLWQTVAMRVRHGEMPPRPVPGPAKQERNSMAEWIESELLLAACATGLSPGPNPTRRLSRSEYDATVRDLLNVHSSVASAFPHDGAGGEGFDNAAETLTLSPIHLEKYLQAAGEALQHARRDARSRRLYLTLEPGNGITPEQAASRVLADFLPRAFRRPARADEHRRYYGLFWRSQQEGRSFEDSILYALRAAMVSPHFLLLVEEPASTPGPVPLNDYELASRLSYFLWGSMPDKELFELAAAGTLREPEVLDAQIKRMLASNSSNEFAISFVEQWLGTRELGRDIQPDPVLFPEYQDRALQAVIKNEPILMFQHILRENRSLLELLDSSYTIVDRKLQSHYGFGLPKVGQRFIAHEIPEEFRSQRGGLLGMSAVLAVSSMPNRTSPVLRGKWILESILGTPPPPPPPVVPALAEAHEGEVPKTLRERLERHRAEAVCASCHDRIDPLGFGLENYDVLGRWRTEDAGRPIDSRGQLPDGATFDGPAEMKIVLLERKDLFIKNLTSKLLGYALGRGLTTGDACIVDGIVKQLEQNHYAGQALIQAIVHSVPFRYKPGTDPERAVLAGGGQSEGVKP